MQCYGKKVTLQAFRAISFAIKMVNKTLQSAILMMVDIVLESSFILVKVDVILIEASPQAALLFMDIIHNSFHCF